MSSIGHTRIGRVSAAVSLVAAMALSGILLASPPVGAQLPPGGTFTDDNGNTHEGYIEAIAAAEITLGCNPEGTLYCPADPGATRPNGFFPRPRLRPSRSEPGLLP